MKHTKGEKIFYAINYLILTLIAFTTLYPFLYVLSASISNPEAVITGKVIFFPKGIEFESYKKVLSQSGLWKGYANTVFYAVVGTAVSLFVTICGAYPLSKKRLRGKFFITFTITLTMWFQPGIMPFYLNIRNLHMLDNRWALIFAFACTAFYVILLKTYFLSIPDSMEESAKMDGANDLLILLKIYLPLSIPALMTVGLYYFVGRWNSYFWAMILLQDANKIPLQVFLKQMLTEMSVSAELSQTIDVTTYSNETVIYATIIVAALPMLIIYPFVQKYFVKGAMIGAVKE